MSEHPDDIEKRIEDGERNDMALWYWIATVVALPFLIVLGVGVALGFSLANWS